jgi:hypothetical protein
MLLYSGGNIFPMEKKSNQIDFLLFIAPEKLPEALNNGLDPKKVFNQLVESDPSLLSIKPYKILMPFLNLASHKVLLEKVKTRKNSLDDQISRLKKGFDRAAHLVNEKDTQFAHFKKLSEQGQEMIMPCASVKETYFVFLHIQSEVAALYLCETLSELNRLELFMQSIESKLSEGERI